jgi:hypothetical protein
MPAWPVTSRDCASCQSCTSMFQRLSGEGNMDGQDRQDEARARAKSRDRRCDEEGWRGFEQSCDCPVSSGCGILLAHDGWIRGQTGHRHAKRQCAGKTSGAALGHARAPSVRRRHHADECSILRPCIAMNRGGIEVPGTRAHEPIPAIGCEHSACARRAGSRSAAGQVSAPGNLPASAEHSPIWSAITSEASVQGPRGVKSNVHRGARGWHVKDRPMSGV